MKRYTRYHKTNPPPYSAWNALPCRLRQRPSETAKGISAARRERIKAAAARAQPHRGWIAADPSQGGVRVLITGPPGFERTVAFALDEAPGDDHRAGAGDHRLVGDVRDWFCEERREARRNAKSVV
jgi:hypothetical protein